MQQVKTTKSNIQDRLKAAVEKDIPIKISIDEQIRRHEEMVKSRTNLTNNIEIRANNDDHASSFKSEGPTDNERPFADESCVNEIVEKMKNTRIFKRTIEMDIDLQDSLGFNPVQVTAIEEKAEGMIMYSVMPMEAKESYNAYKLALAATYCDTRIPAVSLQDLSKFRKHMVITKIDNEWVRANILNISVSDNLVSVEDIDSGRKAILKMSRDIIKIPEEAELQKTAFVIKVYIENMEDNDILEKDDIVKIKITQSIPLSFSWAEIKTGHITEDDEVIIKMPATPVKKQESPNTTPLAHKTQVNVPKQKLEEHTPKLPKRIFFEQIQVKAMNEGHKVTVLFIDSSNINRGLLTVSESLMENWAFFSMLEKEIASYVKENPCTKIYKPE